MTLKHTLLVALMLAAPLAHAADATTPAGTKVPATPTRC